MTVAGTALIALGVVVFAVGGVGLLRLRDFYARLSGISMVGGAGTVLVLLGLLLHFPSPGNAVKIGLAVLIQLATAGVGGNAMARAGYLTRVPATPATRYDELAEAPAGPVTASEAAHHPGRSADATAVDGDGSGDPDRPTGTSGTTGTTGTADDGAGRHDA